MDKTPIKTYYRKELVNLYGVTNTTFVNWITMLDEQLAIEIKCLRAFTPKQVQKIFDLIGEP